MSETRTFLSRPSHEVAPDLLGWSLRHVTDEDVVMVEITEVEAYGGQSDPASHAYRGPTPRSSVMFGPAGRVYLYRSYGIHVCCNVVTGTEGEASAVLIRAGRVTEGIDLARRRRGDVADPALARGPGNLGRALGLTLPQSGRDLLTSASLALVRPAHSPAFDVSTGPRVGITRATQLPWRFWWSGDATVSAYRAGVMA